MRERKPNEEVAFIREAYGLRAALFFLSTGCTFLLWPRLKAGPSGPSARFGCAT